MRSTQKPFQVAIRSVFLHSESIMPVIIALPRVETERPHLGSHTIPPPTQAAPVSRRPIVRRRISTTTGRASMVHKVILIGRLGKDPELRAPAGGQTVARFSLATDEKFTDRNGEKQERTEWHNIVVWGKLAEICGQYLRKGKLVYIDGSIRSDSWD